MDCPKCGQESPAGAEECAACGIIFARYSGNWRAGGRDLWIPPPPRVEGKKDSGNNVLLIMGLFTALVIGVAVYMKQTGKRLPESVEDAALSVVVFVLIGAAVIYKFMVAKNARL